MKTPHSHAIVLAIGLTAIAGFAAPALGEESSENTGDNPIFLDGAKEITDLADHEAMNENAPLYSERYGSPDGVAISDLFVANEHPKFRGNMEIVGSQLVMKQVSGSSFGLVAIQHPLTLPFTLDFTASMEIPEDGWVVLMIIVDGVESSVSFRPDQIREKHTKTRLPMQTQFPQRYRVVFDEQGRGRFYVFEPEPTSFPLPGRKLDDTDHTGITLDFRLNNSSVNLESVDVYEGNP